ncbi:hypothetical protein ACE6H2_011982 [Prunus campanulata]
MFRVDVAFLFNTVFLCFLDQHKFWPRARWCIENKRTTQAMMLDETRVSSFCFFWV